MVYEPFCYRIQYIYTWRPSLQQSFYERGMMQLFTAFPSTRLMRTCLPNKKMPIYTVYIYNNRFRERKRKEREKNHITRKPMGGSWTVPMIAGDAGKAAAKAINSRRRPRTIYTAIYGEILACALIHKQQPLMILPADAAVAIKTDIGARQAEMISSFKSTGLRAPIQHPPKDPYRS